MAEKVIRELNRSRNASYHGEEIDPGARSLALACEVLPAVTDELVAQLCRRRSVHRPLRKLSAELENRVRVKENLVELLQQERRLRSKWNSRIRASQTDYEEVVREMRQQSEQVATETENHKKANHELDRLQRQFANSVQQNPSRASPIKEQFKPLITRARDAQRQASERTAAAESRVMTLKAKSRAVLEELKGAVAEPPAELVQVRERLRRLAVLQAWIEERRMEELISGASPTGERSCAWDDGYSREIDELAKQTSLEDIGKQLQGWLYEMPLVVSGV